MKLSLKASAKINLMLDLTGTLANGYHCIHTVMQSVGLYDFITLETNDSGKLTLHCNKPYIPTDSRNTAYKAAELFYKSAGIPFKGLDITVKKNIPCQAGLGGGSSDSAAVLNGLNIMYGNPFTSTELMFISEETGADVPFCINGGTAYCANIGELVAPIQTPPYYSVIVKPEQCVSTKEAYRLFNNTENIRHCDCDNFIYAVKKQNFADICKYAVNVFEQAIEVTDRIDIKTKMRKCGAGYSMMTGSGSAIFGVFENKKDARMCYNEIKPIYPETFFAPFNEKSIYLTE